MSFTSSFDAAAFQGLLSEFPSQEGWDAARSAIQIGGDSGVEALSIKRPEVFLTTLLVDDSGSMAEYNRKDDAKGATDKMLSELRATSGKFPHRVYAAVGTLNKGLLHGFKPLEEVVSLSDANYNCDGLTPLLGALKHGLGTVLKGALELSALGINVQTATVVVSDGGYNDQHGSEYEPGPFGYQDPEEIGALIRSMTATKDHTVYGVAIGAGAKEAFLRVGFKENYVLDPVNEEFSFEAALSRITRFIATASANGEKLSELWAQKTQAGSADWQE